MHVSVCVCVLACVWKIRGWEVDVIHLPLLFSTLFLRRDLWQHMDHIILARQDPFASIHSARVADSCRQSWLFHGCWVLNFACRASILLNAALQAPLFVLCLFKFYNPLCSECWILCKLLICSILLCLTLAYSGLLSPLYHIFHWY